MLEKKKAIIIGTNPKKTKLAKTMLSLGGFEIIICNSKRQARKIEKLQLIDYTFFIKKGNKLK